jgi:hypothetical protein
MIETMPVITFLQSAGDSNFKSDLTCVEIKYDPKLLLLADVNGSSLLKMSWTSMALFVVGAQLLLALPS